MKRIITTALMLTFIVACSFAQSIVGSWKTTPETFAAMGLPEGSTGAVFFNFKKDKTCTVDLDISVEQATPQFTMKMRIKAMIPGTYSATNSTLKGVFNAQKMTCDIDLSFPGMDAATEKQIMQLMNAQLPALKQQMKNELAKSIGKPMEGQYSIEGDILTADNITLKRVK